MSWRCATCWKWAATKESQTSECKGPPGHFKSIVTAAAAAGHQLAHLRPRQAGVPALAICLACGAMATQGAKSWSNLLTVCGRGTANHKSTAGNLKRAAETTQPYSFECACTPPTVQALHGLGAKNAADTFLAPPQLRPGLDSKKPRSDRDSFWPHCSCAQASTLALPLLRISTAR